MSESLIYTGPDVAKLGVMQFQVYINGLPLYVKRAIEKIPDIEKLIVPVEDLELTREKIKTSGTMEASIYKRIQKAVQELRVKK